MYAPDSEKIMRGPFSCPIDDRPRDVKSNPLLGTKSRPKTRISKTSAVRSRSSTHGRCVAANNRKEAKGDQVQQSLPRPAPWQTKSNLMVRR